MQTNAPTSRRLLIDVQEAADRLSIGRTLALRMVYTGELPSVQIGRRRLIVESDLCAFIERRRVTDGAHS